MRSPLSLFRAPGLEAPWDNKRAFGPIVNTLKLNNARLLFLFTFLDFCFLYFLVQSMLSRFVWCHVRCFHGCLNGDCETADILYDQVRHPYNRPTVQETRKRERAWLPLFHASRHLGRYGCCNRQLRRIVLPCRADSSTWLLLLLRCNCTSDMKGRTV